MIHICSYAPVFHTWYMYWYGTESPNIFIQMLSFELPVIFLDMMLPVHPPHRITIPHHMTRPSINGGCGMASHAPTCWQYKEGEWSCTALYCTVLGPVSGLPYYKLYYCHSSLPALCNYVVRAETQHSVVQGGREQGITLSNGSTFSALSA